MKNYSYLIFLRSENAKNIFVDFIEVGLTKQQANAINGGNTSYLENIYHKNRKPNSNRVEFLTASRKLSYFEVLKYSEELVSGFTLEKGK